VTLQAFLTGAGPRDVRTVVLEEFEFGLTETGTTRTLAENFSITVLSVGGKQLR
jgi:hypothetical protein